MKSDHPAFGCMFILVLLTMEIGGTVYLGTQWGFWWGVAWLFFGGPIATALALAVMLPIIMLVSSDEERLQ